MDSSAYTHLNLNLQEIEVINLLGEPEHISQKEMSFWCPKCNPPHHKPKLFVNRSTFQAHCFVCGFKASGIGALAARLKKSSKYGNYVPGESFSDKIELALTLGRENHEHKNAKAKLPNGLVNVEFGDPVSTLEARRYLMSRGLSRADIARWRIMYGAGNDLDHNMRGRVVFPSFDAEGKLNYYVGRAIWKPPADATFFMPYKDGPRDSYKSEIIFNEVDVDWSREVVLVEGIFDAIHIENAIPMLGKTMQPYWKLFTKIVETNARVVIMLDGDAAVFQHQLAAMLKAYSVEHVKCVWLPEDIDPGMLSREGCLAYLEQAEPYNDGDSSSFEERIKNGPKSTKKKYAQRAAHWQDQIGQIKVAAN